MLKIHGLWDHNSNNVNYYYCTTCQDSFVREHEHFKGLKWEKKEGECPCLVLPTNDPVNHPSHYTFGRFEVIDVLEDWFPEDPLLWQTVKYLARAKHKGNFLQDLKKAQFYLNKRIESEEK
jgi:hypothetical protein